MTGDEIKQVPVHVMTAPHLLPVEMVSLLPPEGINGSFNPSHWYFTRFRYVYGARSAENTVRYN